MAKNNRIMADDILRMPPHIQAQIAQQMEDQGSQLPPPRGVRRGAHGHVPQVEMTPKVYMWFGAYFAVMGVIAILLMATFPVH